MTTSNPFANYSPDELEAQRRVISAGYLIITVASFLAMTFFITHNMIGTEKPIWDSVNGLNWGAGQLAYLVISVGFAFGFNAFTWHFYQMESSAKQKAFVLFVAVAFPMFAEIGQSMTRAEQTRHEAATQSETFKTMQQRVAKGGVSVDTGATTALSNAMADKAKAETELAACSRYTNEQRRAKCERIETGNINAAQARITAAQQVGNQTLTASQQQLSADAATLKALEGDSGFLQPIVRLMMDAGLPALGASFAVAFIIIGAMEVAMSYLGGLLRQLKERMRELGLAVSSSKIQARYANGVSMSLSPAPMPEGVMSKLANGADSAKQTVSEYAAKVEQGLKASPEVIANEYAKAQQAREQLYKSAADKLDGLTPENLTRERFFKLMYMEIRSRVLNGEVRPTVTPVTDAVTDVIRKHTKVLGLQPSLIGKPERQKIAEKILEKLEREQVLELNPVQGVGNPKYLLAQRWRKEPTSHIPVPENDGWKPTWEKTTIQKVMEPQVKPDMPQLVETSGFKQSPEQRAMVDRLHQEQMQTYRQELRNGEKVYSDQPLDKPRPVQQMSVADTVKQIERDVKASGANTPEAIKAAVFDSFAALQHPAPLGDVVLGKLAEKLSEKTATPLVPVNQKPGGTGLQNPALGSAEEHYPLPLPTTTPDCLKGNDRATPETTPEQSPETTPRTTKRGSFQTAPQLPKGAVSTPEEGVEKSDSYGLFEAWRGAVLAGLKPSSGKFYQFAREHGSFAGIANRELDLMWNGFGERGVNEGWLTVNPDYKQGSTSPKFKLNADFKQAA